MQDKCAKTEKKAERRPMRRRAFRFLVICLVLLCGLAGAAVYFALDRNLALPDWARDRIEQRIEANLDGLTIDFGAMEFVVNHGWRPRVRLRDVELKGREGQTLAQLSEAEVALAMRPLLRGQVQPKKIALFGAIGSLQRASGGVALSLGTGGTPLEQSANLVELVEEWDQFFQRPELAALTEVDLEALTLQYEDLEKARAWTLDGGTIRLRRTGDKLSLNAGFSLLSGRDYASAIELSYASVIGDAQADVSVSVQEIPSEDIAVQNISLAWLGVLEAPISGSIRGRVDRTGEVGPVSATLQIGEGWLRPDNAAKPVPFTGAKTYFTYDPAQQVLDFDEISIESGLGEFRADGRTYLNTQHGQLQDLVGQINLQELRADTPTLFEEPLRLSGGKADFKLELDPFRLTLGEAVLRHESVDLRASGSLSVKEQDWFYALDAELGEISPPDLLPLWPPLLAPKPREWVEKNLTEGILSDARFALRGAGEAEPTISAGFAFRDATIKAIKSQPPIRGGEGYATFENFRFVVSATGGVITGDDGGPVDITGTNFVIPDTRIKGATPAEVYVKATGSVTAALSALNRPPLRVLKDSALPVDMVDGIATLTGEVDLLLKKKIEAGDVTFDFRGSLNSVTSDVLVPGHKIVAPSLWIEGDENEVRLSGDGALSGVPLAAAWTRPIGKGVAPDSDVTAVLDLTSDVLDVFNITLPPGAVNGETPAQVVVHLDPGKPTRITVTSDLKGAQLSIPQLGWSKAPGGAGDLRIEAIMGETPVVERIALDAPGLFAMGRIRLKPGGGLDRAIFDDVRVGNWFKGAADLIRRGEAPPSIAVRAGTLDLRTAPFGATQSAGRSDGGPIDARLERVQISDSFALDGFVGTFSNAGGFNGRFEGRLNGGAPITGVLVPQEKGTAIRVQAPDAGAVLRGAGILSNARSGSFEMTLQPTGEPGNFRGNIIVRNTRVKDGPALAALINAISVVGLIDEMAGNGITFTTVRAEFGLSPDRVTIYRSSAEGPSIGLSMDGTYSFVQNALDMRGVISPLYLVNAIGSVLTRPGEGLIGFNYRLTGPASDPSVTVNPLSGLTPSFLREVFRQPPPRDPDAPVRPPAAQQEKADPFSAGQGEDR